jgi:hypothetical protein
MPPNGWDVASGSSKPWFPIGPISVPSPHPDSTSQVSDSLLPAAIGAWARRMKQASHHGSGCGWRLDQQGDVLHNASRDSRDSGSQWYRPKMSGFRNVRLVLNRDIPSGPEWGKRCGVGSPFGDLGCNPSGSKPQRVKARLRKNSHDWWQQTWMWADCQQVRVGSSSPCAAL